MTTDEFVNNITKPLYVYRMAKANLESTNPAMVKSAKTRMRNAAREIARVAEIHTNYGSIYGEDYE